MKTSLKVSGINQVILQLRNIADKVDERARKTMHRGADEIEKRAKLYAPHDTGALEDSIHQEVQYEYRGRLAIDVVAGGIVDGVDVEAYVLEIHENYSDMKPGPGTIAKMNANPGVIIGEKFLERAYQEQEQKLHAVMVAAIDQEWML